MNQSTNRLIRPSAGVNQSTRRLIRPSADRQARAVAHADAAADAVDRAIVRAWDRLMALVRRKPPAWELQYRVAPLVAEIVKAAHGALLPELERLAGWSHQAEAEILARRLPLRYLRAAAVQAPARRLVREAAFPGPGLGHLGIDPRSGLKTYTPLAGDTLAQLATGDSVSFERHAKAGGGEVAVWVDPARLDAAWQQDGSYYLPPRKAGSSEVPGRRQGVRRFLATGKPVQAPRVTYDPTTGGVAFEDGRHRFAALRDDGASRVPIMVPADQAEDFAARFGAGRGLDALAPLLPPQDAGDKGRDYLANLLFPPLRPPQIAALLRHPIAGSTWQQSLAHASKLANPATLVQLIIAGFSAGKNPREVATDLLPAVQGYKVSARRIARTYGMQIAHAAQQDAHAQLGDLVIGWQVHSAHSPNSRSWHVERDGTIYYLNPGPGQKGMAQCPHPPLEAEDPRERPAKAPKMAWNCLCYLTPVLRPLEGAAAVIAS